MVRHLVGIHGDALSTPLIRETAERVCEDARMSVGGKPCPDGFRNVRLHDLRHTYGYRLRAAGVAFEDHQVLLGHKTQHITTHY